MSEHHVAELVHQRMGGLSPAETRLARALLASYPVAGLESLARFAERAGVSTATVTRFVAKLGIEGYPEFQEALRTELQERLSSPLARYEHEQRGALHGGLTTAFEAFQENLRRTSNLLEAAEFDQVVGLVADTRRGVFVLGGRVSAPLARYFAAQLHLLRPRVALLEADRGTPRDRLVDLRQRDVLVVFDYRRYQADTIQAARETARRGGLVVLLTDPWMSPAAACARHVLMSSVETSAPFDSMVAAMAVVEALIDAVLARLGESAHRRMRRIDELRDGVAGS